MYGAGLDQAFLGAAGHLFNARQLGWVDAQEPASGAGMFVDARRPVGAMTITKRDFAKQEVVLELGPLFTGSRAQLPERPRGSAPFDEVLVRRDHFLREDRLWRRRVSELSECLGHGGEMGLRPGGDIDRM
jgi:hypothetical protein